MKQRNSMPTLGFQFNGIVPPCKLSPMRDWFFAILVWMSLQIGLETSGQEVEHQVCKPEIRCYEAEDLLTQLLHFGSLLEPAAEKSLCSFVLADLERDQTQELKSVSFAVPGFGIQELGGKWPLAKVIGEQLWILGTPNQQDEVAKTLRCFRENGFKQTTLFLRKISVPKALIELTENERISAQQATAPASSTGAKYFVLSSDIMARIRTHIETVQQHASCTRSEFSLFNGQSLLTGDIRNAIIISPFCCPEQNNVAVSVGRTQLSQKGSHDRVSVVEGVLKTEMDLATTVQVGSTLAIAREAAELDASEMATVLLLDFEVHDLGICPTRERLEIFGPVCTDANKEETPPPSDDEIAFAIERKWHRNAVFLSGAKTRKDLLSERIGAVQFVPLIGWAKERHQHYRFVVSRPEANGIGVSEETFEIDRKSFVMSEPPK